MTACCGKPVKDSGPPGVAATRRVIGGLFCVSDRVEIVCLWAGEPQLRPSRFRAARYEPFSSGADRTLCWARTAREPISASSRFCW